MAIKMHIEKNAPMLWRMWPKDIYIFYWDIYPPLKMDYLKKWTDDFWIVPICFIHNRQIKIFWIHVGHNARALIFVLGMMKQHKQGELENLMIYIFSFIQKCQQKDGQFINYIDFKE